VRRVRAAAATFLDAVLAGVAGSTIVASDVAVARGSPYSGRGRRMLRSGKATPNGWSMAG